MATFTNQGGADDTWIRSTSADTNFGTGGNVIVIQTGNFNGAPDQLNRSLIKWDLSSIPSNATVTGGTLSLWTQADWAGINTTLQLFRIRTGRTWAGTNATWNKYDGVNAWTTAGAADTTSDREGTNVGSVVVGSNTVVDTEVKVPLGTTALTEWINGGTTNRGWLVQTDEGATDDNWVWHSSDGTNAALEPKLVIDYTVPPAGSQIASFRNLMGVGI